MSKKTSQKSKLSNLQEISVILLDEDPSQPRKFFDPDALKELADSIRQEESKHRFPSDLMLKMVVIPLIMDIDDIEQA